MNRRERAVERADRDINSVIDHFFYYSRVSGNDARDELTFPCSFISIMSSGKFYFQFDKSFPWRLETLLLLTGEAH